MRMSKFEKAFLVTMVVLAVGKLICDFVAPVVAMM